MEEKKTVEPLVSVIIPGYNIEKYAERCLKSICNQTYQKLEIILIDDGSTDLTAHIFDACRETDARVKVLHKENGGVSSARNQGISLAEGEYILFVDGDDWLEKNAVELLVQSALKYKSDVVLFEYSVDDEKRSCLKKIHPELQGPLTIEKAIYYTITPVNRFAVTKLYKRSSIENLRFDESIHLGEDTLFACQAIDKGEIVYFLAEPLYHYVQSSESATRKSFFDERMLTGEKAYREISEMCMEKYPDITETAWIQYVELVMAIIVDMYKEPLKNKKQIRSYKRIVQRYWWSICKSTEGSIKTKMKVTLCSVSALVMTKLHRCK